MGRHNRRRTRPRSIHRNSVSPIPQTPEHSFTQLCLDNSPTSRSPVTLAPSWHHGYTAWQTREQSWNSGLEEQCRLFGGEPGDDVSLCDRMLEYFGGLDYINSGHALGD